MRRLSGRFGALRLKPTLSPFAPASFAMAPPAPETQGSKARHNPGDEVGVGAPPVHTAAR
jgi:hypothetical protein